MLKAKSISSHGSSEFSEGHENLAGIRERADSTELSPAQRLRPSALSPEVIQASTERLDFGEPEPCTPIRRINSQYVNEYIRRTETMQLQVLVHEMLRFEVTELLKEVSERGRKWHHLYRAPALRKAPLLLSLLSLLAAQPVQGHSEGDDSLLVV